MADEGPSLPSDYVTILHLKERWLKQQQQQPSAQSNPNHLESDSQLTVKSIDDSVSKIPNEFVHRTRESDFQLTVKPKDDSASKIPNESVHRGTNRHPVVNQTKCDATVDDSASKTPKETVHCGRNRNRMINQLQPEVTPPHDSASKTPKESFHRRRDSNRMINQLQSKVTPHDSASKTVVQAADNHPIVEKQEHNADHSNPKLSTTKNSSRGRNPRSVTNQIPTGGGIPPSEPEPMPEKKQHRYKGKRRNRNEEARPKGQLPPLAQNVVESSHNDCGGDGVVEAVAAAVKEINITDVSKRTTRKWVSRRFSGTGPAKPPFVVKKGQTTGVWVKKGESAPN